MGTLNEYIVPWHCVYPLEYLVGLESNTGDKYGYFIPKENVAKLLFFAMYFHLLKCKKNDSESLFRKNY